MPEAHPRPINVLYWLLLLQIHERIHLIGRLLPASSGPLCCLCLAGRAVRSGVPEARLRPAHCGRFGAAMVSTSGAGNRLKTCKGMQAMLAAS